MRKKRWTLFVLLLVGVLQISFGQGGCTCPQLSINLIDDEKGDFENNFPFFSQFDHDVIGCNDPQSALVGSTPSEKCSTWPSNLYDHTLGTPAGHFLIIDGRFDPGFNEVLISNEGVRTPIPGRVYEFHFWTLRWDPNVAPSFELNITEALLDMNQPGNGIHLYFFTTQNDPLNEWVEHCITYVSEFGGPHYYALIQRDPVNGGYGIDDITFQGCCDPTNPLNLPANTRVCRADAPVVLDAGSGYAAYEWSYNHIILGTERTLSTGTEGTYHLLVTTEEGCQYSDETEVTIVDLNLNLSSSTTEICTANQETAVLTATSSIFRPSYTWTKDGLTLNGNGPSLTVTEPGTYTVSLSSNFGNPKCTETKTIVIGNSCQSELEVSKKAYFAGIPGDIFYRGQYITWEVTITNTGTSSATFDYTDYWPTNQNGCIVYDPVLSSAPLSGTGITLAAGASTTLIFAAKICGESNRTDTFINCVEVIETNSRTTYTACDTIKTVYGCPGTWVDRETDCTTDPFYVRLNMHLPFTNNVGMDVCLTYDPTVMTPDPAYNFNFSPNISTVNPTVQSVTITPISPTLNMMQIVVTTADTFSITGAGINSNPIEVAFILNSPFNTCCTMVHSCGLVLTNNLGLSNSVYIDPGEVCLNSTCMAQYLASSITASETCLRDQLTLQVSGNFDPAKTVIKWSNGENQVTSIDVTTPGTYWVVLVNETGCYDSLVYEVEACNYPPCAVNIEDITFCLTDCKYTFTPTVTTDPALNLTYLWEFSDNTTSTDPIPTHVFLTQGLHTVKLTITANNGFETCSSTFEISVMNSCNSISCAVNPIFTVAKNNMTTDFGIVNYDLTSTTVLPFGTANVLYEWILYDKLGGQKIFTSTTPTLLISVPKGVFVRICLRVTVEVNQYGLIQKCDNMTCINRSFN